MAMPETIGGYAILNEIGSGGFGTVYRAYDPSNGRPVALKTLDSKLAGSNVIERFRREAQLTSEINHPNVIDILDADEDDGVHFIVMEMMPLSLRDALSAGSLPISRAIDICSQAALGLRLFHERGIYHRDIKPDNILIDSNGTVKVSDFGIAHADDLPDLTATGVRIGTGRYMSPEQIMDSKRVDARADIYSLGVTLYEMLTGKRYERDGSAKASRPAIPSDLERIVSKCLEIDRENRYESVDDLLQEIASHTLINKCALIDLYEATNGNGWERNDSWLTEAPLNDWHGVNVDRHGFVVTRIILRSNNLEGKIPSEIANLTKLAELDLSGNRLSGSIPPELGNLTKLKWLNLSGNRLSGSIPPELGNLTELESIDLNSRHDSLAISTEPANSLSGNIPPELGSLTKLKVLDIGDGRFLSGLRGNGNRVSGSIPLELGNLIELAELDLSGNRLSGSIPPELGSLAELKSINLSRNGLSGSIPPELGRLTELKTLRLSNNGLSGSIPLEIGSLAKLKWLFLDRNRLSGSIPPELSRLAKLKILELRGNNWTGCIPRAVFNIMPVGDLDKIDLPVCDD